MRKLIIDSTTKVVVNAVEMKEGANWSPPEGQEFAPNNDGDVGDTWNGTSWTPKTLPPPDPVTPEQVKEERTQMLKDTDWESLRAMEALLLKDTPLGIWRKGLRDITDQPTYPENVVWPTKPKG